MTEALLVNVSENGDWSMWRLNPQYFAIKNLTGDVASEVVMTLSGAVVAGVAGQDENEWRLVVPEIQPDAEVADVFVRAWGVGTPMLHIIWKDPDGGDHADQVEIPFKSFNNPELRSPIPPGLGAL